MRSLNSFLLRPEAHSPSLQLWLNEMLAATTFGAASLCPPKLHSRVRSGLQRAPLLPTQPGVPPIRRRRRSRPAAPTALLWGKKPAVVERPMTMADFNSMIETATTPAVLVDFCTAW